MVTVSIYLPTYLLPANLEWRLPTSHGDGTAPQPTSNGAYTIRPTSHGPSQSDGDLSSLTYTDQPYIVPVKASLPTYMIPLPITPINVNGPSVIDNTSLKQNIPILSPHSITILIQTIIFLIGV